MCVSRRRSSTIATALYLVSDVYKNNFLENWSVMSKLRKPVIAAVSGFAVRISHPVAGTINQVLMSSWAVDVN